MKKPSILPYGTKKPKKGRCFVLKSVFRIKKAMLSAGVFALLAVSLSVAASLSPTYRAPSARENETPDGEIREFAPPAAPARSDGGKSSPSEDNPDAGAPSDVAPVSPSEDVLYGSWSVPDVNSPDVADMTDDEETARPLTSENGRDEESDPPLLDAPSSDGPESVTPAPAETPTPAPVPTKTPTPTPAIPTQDPPETDAATGGAPVKDRDFLLTVFDADSGTVKTVPLDDYVRLALAAEMSGDAPEDALKAQAIAIRSYVLSKASVSYKCHHGAMACNDFTHCMACLTEEEFMRINRADRSCIEKTVKETDGLVVVYDGRIVTTNFHSCSYYSTASALEVFGVDLPYLQSVLSPVYTPYIHVYVYTTETLINNFFGPTTGAKILENGEERYGGLAETDSGRVKFVKICGKEIPGLRFREIFSFNSARFDVSYDPEKDAFTFTVYGSGHGVGLSQSGAKALAAQGTDFRSILLYYYRGVEVRPATEALLDGIDGY